MRSSGRLVAGIAALFFAGGAFADSAPPFADFTFKRIKPPSADGGRRITIQISPEEYRAQTPAPKPDDQKSEPEQVVAAPASPQTAFGWFWDAVSPDLTAGGPGRLEPALVSLSNPPAGEGVTTPQLQSLMAIARARNAELLLNTVGTGVSPALVLAVIAVESGGRADAVSKAGAEGLMQLIPATADRFGVTDSLDAGQNIRGGTAYLDWLLKEFGGDPILALAAYNAGENAVRKHGGVPPFPETRAYVPKVLAAFSVARGLCKTPPELVSDGCVFNLGG